MDRRKFIGQTAKFTAATALPFILPSGRLFATTDSPRVKHVVYCLFAGGIRNWESIDFREGNLMPNTLIGDAEIAQDIRYGIEDMPAVFETPIQHHGTLFKGFKYNSNVTLHYHAHATAISGHYSPAVALMKPLEQPSVFEYFRKHSELGQKALKTWWVSDQGGPFPFLQYSNHRDYGLRYAANMIQPSRLFEFPFAALLPQSEKQHIAEMAELLKQFKQSAGDISRTQINTPEEKEQLRELILRIRQDNFSERIRLWPELAEELVNDDLINIFMATEILKAFKPHLLVVNMQDSDIGHSNFTGYCNNLHKADYALAKLWKTIQEDEELKDNTVMIAVPEFGRNKTNNPIIDKFGRYAVDHTGDELSKQMFCLLVGPPGIIQQNKIVSEEYGDAIDVVPTIAHLLGFDQMIHQDLLKGKVLYEALV